MTYLRTPAARRIFTGVLDAVAAEPGTGHYRFAESLRTALTGWR